MVKQTGVKALNLITSKSYNDLPLDNPPQLARYAVYELSGPVAKDLAITSVQRYIENVIVEKYYKDDPAKAGLFVRGQLNCVASIAAKSDVRVMRADLRKAASRMYEEGLRLYGPSLPGGARARWDTAVAVWQTAWAPSLVFNLAVVTVDQAVLLLGLAHKRYRVSRAQKTLTNPGAAPEAKRAAHHDLIL